MIFQLRNFAKITEADIKLDGITVICGDNNTGKSTVGKALFSFFNSLYDYKKKILSEKTEKISDFINRYSNSFEDFLLFDNNKDFFYRHDGQYTVEEIKQYLSTYTSLRVTEDRITSLVEYLNSSEGEIINEYVFRYFNNIMNGQTINIHSANRCSISVEFKDSKKTTIKFRKRSCRCDQGEPVEHLAYYINNPFMIDWLNQGNFRLRGISVLEKNVVSAILKYQDDINENSMTNIIDSVLNKKDIDEVRKVLRNAYKGNTRILEGRYYYHENDVDYDFRNISAGLKSFAIIERLLESGVLKRKDILILDEPEIHLHSEWQIIYAELIVILQKTFDLTILLVTHSFQFLEAIEFFTKKYGINEKCNYYVPCEVEKGFQMKSCGNNPDVLKENLAKGSISLANMEFEFNFGNENDI